MKNILPKNNPVVIEGPVFYNIIDRCNSVIRLKKKLVNEFPDFKKRKGIRYRIELWKTHDDLQERVKDIVKKRKCLPLLLFFYNEESKDRN